VLDWVDDAERVLADATREHALRTPETTGSGER
jgi:hypothetical protein